MSSRKHTERFHGSFPVRRVGFKSRSGLNNFGYIKLRAKSRSGRFRSGWGAYVRSNLEGYQLENGPSPARRAANLIRGLQMLYLLENYGRQPARGVDKLELLRFDGENIDFSLGGAINGPYSCNVTRCSSMPNHYPKNMAVARVVKEVSYLLSGSVGSSRARKYFNIRSYVLEGRWTNRHLEEGSRTSRNFSRRKLEPR